MNKKMSKHDGSEEKIKNFETSDLANIFRQTLIKEKTENGWQIDQSLAEIDTSSVQIKAESLTNLLKREASEQIPEPQISKKLKTEMNFENNSCSSNDTDILPDSEEDEEESQALQPLQRRNKIDRNRKIFIRPKDLTNEDVQGWYFTKKPIGILTYWDGRSLYSCHGVEYKPPKTFLEDFPKDFPLLGVLHKPKADLNEHRSLVREKGDAWLELKFIIYDTPKGDQKFKNRIEEIKNVLDEDSSFVQLSKYEKFDSEFTLLAAIRDLDQEGEAIYFKHGEKPFRSGLGGGFLQLYPENDYGKSSIKRFCQTFLEKDFPIEKLLSL